MSRIHRIDPSVPTGFSLIEVLFTLAWLGTVLIQSLGMGTQSAARQGLLGARAAFESDWRAARWRAARQSLTLRLQAISPCQRPGLSGGWHCGWLLSDESSGRVIFETRLAAGLMVTVKPNAPWRIDAWGDPLTGGASILFQSVTDPTASPELLCMNVLGRLRRLRAETCSD